MDVVLDSSWPSPAHADTAGCPLLADRPVWVFVHGALHDHTVWRDIAARAAASGWIPLALDLPGHGRSAGPALSSVETLGHWVNAFLDRLGVKTACIAGHSMGSLIALEAAAQRPERFSALYLLATASPMKVSAKLFDMGAAQPLEAMAWINQLSWSRPEKHPNTANAPHRAQSSASSWTREQTLRLMVETQANSQEPSLLLHDFQLCDAYYGALQACVRISCPTHILIGEHDVMTAGSAAKPLISALDATVHTMAAGHLLMQECPDACWSAMSQALSDANLRP